MAMIAVSRVNGETVTYTAPFTVEQAWHCALSEVAERARQALPMAAERVDVAVQLILGGHVQQREEGQVVLSGESCQCDEADDAEDWCVHRLAKAIYQKAYPRTKELLAQGVEPAPVVVQEPAVPAAAIPREFIVPLHGREFVLYSGLRAMAEPLLVSLTVDFTTVTETLAIAHAVAKLKDGRVFEESADATPDNVGKSVKPSWRRMALTRAKARVLREALNIGMCSKEELETE